MTVISRHITLSRPPTPADDALPTTTTTREILVTGGAGFIGSHLVDALLARPDGPLPPGPHQCRQWTKVVVVDNFAAADGDDDDDAPLYGAALKRANVARHLADPRFRLHETDILDAGGLQRVFAQHRVEAVVHLAARAGVRPSIRDPAAYMATNVTGTLNVLECARRFGVRRFVLGSSSSVYGLGGGEGEEKQSGFERSEAGPPQATPGRAAGGTLRTAGHGEGEGKIKEGGFERSEASPPQATPGRAAGGTLRTAGQGEGEGRIKEMGFERSEASPPQATPGRAGHHDDDDDAARHRPRPFSEDDCTTRPMSPYAASKAAAELLCHTYAHLHGVRCVALRFFTVYGPRQRPDLAICNLGRAALIDRRPPQPGDMPVTHADIAKARRVLGYAPRTHIREGIPKFVAWFLASSHGAAGGG
ncbi:NAD(P)-binding domain protein [Moelleriella libera RCEF 2490]|uniref:NAD(P)-binding domain protein n=1 Tax=Moelleriella libera RCEF 2490 TaxID=1081109 RepID=A0A167VBN7_9HYPO|nr:NAD(P)-binding domain protein [Moelleriella libera RCEF 2490]